MIRAMLCTAAAACWLVEAAVVLIVVVFALPVRGSENLAKNLLLCQCICGGHDPSCANAREDSGQVDAWVDSTMVWKFRRASSRLLSYIQYPLLIGAKVNNGRCQRDVNNNAS